ncbi:DUF5916 domain-containing protein [Balneola vulgaris]|uniref:DUF5916 domain-containing protein n=1 Tax=Balneola vulgaris TaxID=287535 RepID=UPI0003A837F9|nr:DUF5916 domain-containing protein [Balneola vulgaris]
MFELKYRRAIATFLTIAMYSPFVNSQSKGDIAKPSLDAYRLSANESIKLDGILDDQVWSKADKQAEFYQRFPFDGQPASERTEIQVAYSQEHIFIAIKAFDSAPDSIASSLFRRDGSEYSDWVYVSIDSYNDNRTAFTFAVNPRGVQKDILYYNDDEEDIRWDAVWDASTHIDTDGWNAEIRIPLSQIRYTTNKDIQEWGVNFQRRIARKEEVSFWSRTPREEFGLVSWFGDLKGIQGLQKPMRLEILPYVSASDKRAPKPDPAFGENDPFYDKNDLKFKIGGDFKYGISSDFTLTGTINPDFGQVEADPATINLTEFETFFEERRPFFLEGNEIFNFGSTNSQNTYRTHQNFYTRRIGRSPSGQSFQAGIPATFQDRPHQTTIAGAAKVSGKTSNGLSLGILNAYTLEEQARYYDANNDVKGKYIIEPATNYLVGRVRQDISEGDAYLGGFGSAVNRDMSDTYLNDYLHDSAYQIGFDGGYSWANRNWGAYGALSFSSVNGDKQALLRTQTSSARYYNRVDSDYLSVDTDKTSLTGYSGEFSVGKFGGAGLKYSFTYTETSPGYEINDIGFQERADYRAPHYYVEYLNVNPDLFRFYLLWAFGGHAWNFDGDMIMNFYSTGAYIQFNNLWTLTYTGGFTGKIYNDRITRGGPIMRRPKDWNSRIEIGSNSTKPFYATFGSSYRADASGEFTTMVFSTMNYRPTGYLQFSIAPTFLTELNTDQYQAFGDFDDDPELDYLFSDSRIDIFYTDIRLNWTFTPKLSLQTYVRPLFYTADFSRYKTFEERKTYKFNELDASDQSAYESLADFDYRVLQGNAVLRWEYRPGSTLFLVWQQERDEYLGGQSFFEPFKSTPDLFKAEPTNIFLIKLSYWFGN